jgi:hypothetical protein
MTSSDMTVPDHRSVAAFQGQDVRPLHCGQPRYAALSAAIRCLRRVAPRVHSRTEPS